MTAKLDDGMPKAGIEPARGQAPLDFESSASPNSATSARREHRIRLGGLEGRPRRSDNACLPTKATSSAEPASADRRYRSQGARTGRALGNPGQLRRISEEKDI